MALSLEKAIEIAKVKAVEAGLKVNNVCIENFEGWRFALVLNWGDIIPGQPPLFVHTEGETEWEFRGIPPEPIKEARDVDISEYLK